MQVDFMLWLQTWSNPVLDQIFTIITNLGSDSIYIVFVAWLYWCVDQQKGEKWVYLILSSALLNGIVKLTFEAPRPFQVDKGIVAVNAKTATGYSFPSGHSQASAVFGGFLALEYKAKWIKVIGVMLFLSIGLSRLYLRVHWPIDVLCGWGLGLSVAALYHYFYDRYPGVFKGLFIGVLLLSLLFFRDSDQIKLIGLAISVYAGMFVNRRYLNLPVHPFKKGGLLKLILGVCVIVGTLTGLKLVLPESLNIIRYGVVGITLSLFYPWLFSRCYKVKR